MSPEIADIYLMLLKEGWKVAQQWKVVGMPDSVIITFLPPDGNEPYDIRLDPNKSSAVLPFLHPPGCVYESQYLIPTK